MKDAFSLLGLPRRPWLEVDDVRAAFQQKAAGAHPDRQGETGDFAELTQAYETLREPANRLRHLLALEFPELPLPTGVPADLMEWFPKVGAQLQKLKDAARAKAAATSALARVLATSGLPEAESFQTELKRVREQRHEQVRKLDAAWPAVEPGELAAIVHRLGFLDKWLAQLADAILALRL